MVEKSQKWLFCPVEWDQVIKIIANHHLIPMNSIFGLFYSIYGHFLIFTTGSTNQALAPKQLRKQVPIFEPQTATNHSTEPSFSNKHKEQYLVEVLDLNDQGRFIDIKNEGTNEIYRCPFEQIRFFLLSCRFWHFGLNLAYYDCVYSKYVTLLEEA